MARRGVSATIIAALLGAAVAVGANADGPELPLDFPLQSSFAPKACPPGTPEAVSCFDLAAKTVVPGLGTASFAYALKVDRTDPAGKCSAWTVSDGTITSPKGTIAFGGKSVDCPSIVEGTGATVQLRLIGDGPFKGGSGVATAVYASANLLTSKIDSHWTGTFTVPNYSFDTTPPTINGAATKTIRVRKGHSVRVSYSVSAQDAVDGGVPVTCTPASGSVFRVGRTRVTCTATDTSGNTASTSFFVVVKRRKR